MISREQVANYRNVILCDVHETAWLEILDTLDAALKVVRCADRYYLTSKKFLLDHELATALAPFTAPRGKE